MNPSPWFRLVWRFEYYFVPTSMRISGDEHRAARYLPPEEPGFGITLEHKYLAIALGMLAIAVAILKWWAGER
jgi:hypothetical protein